MAKRTKPNPIEPQLVELLYQALETELGGVEVYKTALLCVQDESLESEWQKYLLQTKGHVERLRVVCEELGLDPDEETPGRQVVRFLGKSLVKTMHLALGASSPRAAELVACECVVHAETKDHANWSLLGHIVKGSSSPAVEVIARAYSEIEDEEDEHLYHTKGWCRELWLQSLGLPAQIPPPEEEQEVHSAMQAAAAAQSRDTF